MFTMRKKVDGILIIPSSLGALHIKKIKDSKIPLIIIDRKPDIEADFLLIKNKMGGSLAAKHLMDLGHKKIGYIDRHVDHFHSIGRRTGFTEAMLQNNLKIKNEHMIRGQGLGYEDGYQL